MKLTSILSWLPLAAFALAVSQLACVSSQRTDVSTRDVAGGPTMITDPGDLTNAPRPWPNYRDTATPTAFHLDTLQHRTFRYFWELSDGFGQIPDRWPTERFSSIAATGFGLPALAVGVERGYVSRAAAAARARRTLRFLLDAPQGPAMSGTIGHKGYFYHFLNHGDGLRYGDTELSTIDTGLLIVGVLAAGEYFDGDNDDERAIRELADALYRRVEWDFAWVPEDNALSMGWRPDRGMIPARWRGYNEAMVLLILALGSPEHAIPASAWETWTQTYDWDGGYGSDEHAMFDPLFGHQYSQLFIDFRGIQDAYMRERGSDYHANSVAATALQIGYAEENPYGFPERGKSELWGLTACDGPGRSEFPIAAAPVPDRYDNEARLRGTDSIRTRAYWARGVDGSKIKDDGTVAPTAAGGSFPYAPEAAEATLAYMWNTYQPHLVGRYGLRDALNLDAEPREPQPGAPGWFDVDYLGIDQGPILIQIENYRTGLVWDLLKSNEHVRRGLERAGFAGGWLEEGIDNCK